MAILYRTKKHKQKNILSTISVLVLICAMFFAMVSFFYTGAKDEAEELLHMQTKQIKDDLALQIKSDRENLVTMAHFASKLYADGESYDRMFASFEPIGLFSNIGILNTDNTFVTKVGTIDLSDKISFKDEAAKGAYISGRVDDLTNSSLQIIRSAVPIVVEDKTVGILYGVIKLDTISEKYNRMAKELDAQLIVYDKENGNYIINTVEGAKGNISSLKTRKYNNGYTYEKLIGNESGYSSFKSVQSGENLYIHYSEIDDIGWKIMLARNESQVFEKTNNVLLFVGILFLLQFLIIGCYAYIVARDKKAAFSIKQKASEIRKLLLKINSDEKNTTYALREIMSTALSRSAIFVDTEGRDYNYMNAAYVNDILVDDDRRYFVSELFRYATEFKNANNTDVGIIEMNADEQLARTNTELYEFLTKHGISNVIFAAATHNNNNNNNVNVLGVINPENKASARALLEEIAVCFSIAIYNKNHLNRTYTAATTDALTGVSNRVAYKKDILVFDNGKPSKFSCIYIDVNELHLRNNKFGHAAGDEMLIYIANALKNTFYGQYIYRMGGDEFLVFAENSAQETINRCVEVLIKELSVKDYHVAIGVSYREKNLNTEEMVRESEIRMYEAKAQYYQNKEQKSISKSEDKNYIQTKTGILEIDTLISILKEHYNGIYRVSLDTDHAHRILVPAYFGDNEEEDNFSKLIAKYADDSVHPDFHRAVMSFMNYDAIKKQLSDNKTPSITYKKTNGETVILSVYQLGESRENAKETLWVFAKD